MDFAHDVLWMQQSSLCASASSLVAYRCLEMQVQRLSSWSSQRQLPRRDNVLVKDEVGAVN